SLANIWDGESSIKERLDKFFHTIIVDRRKRNLLINPERMGGSKCDDLKPLSRRFLDIILTIYHFQSINCDKVLNGIPQFIYSDINAQLTKLVSLDEVKLAMLSISPNNSPNNDS
ncbi:hypothetical protein ACH5RR_026303, partial [Cinchona calisaya]